MLIIYLHNVNIPERARSESTWRLQWNALSNNDSQSKHKPNSNSNCKFIDLKIE